MLTPLGNPPAVAEHETSDGLSQPECSISLAELFVMPF